jgi:hypothetical protein
MGRETTANAAIETRQVLNRCIVQDELQVITTAATYLPRRRLALQFDSELVIVIVRVSQSSSQLAIQPFATGELTSQYLQLCRR